MLFCYFLQFIEFHDSWEAYRHAPCVEFLIRDRNFSPSSSVCVVDVFQEGHEGETAAVSVSTRPRKVSLKIALKFHDHLSKHFSYNFEVSRKLVLSSGNVKNAGMS